MTTEAFNAVMRDKGFVQDQAGHWVKPKTAAQHNLPQVGQVDLPSPSGASNDSLNSTRRNAARGAIRRCQPVAGDVPQNGSRAVGVEGKRVRQEKPKPPTQGEIEVETKLRKLYPQLRAQSIRFRLGNGAWYKPDFVDLTAQKAWEVKGPKQARWSRRGELTIKVAASLYPEVEFSLVWKEDGVWKEQRIES